MQRMQILVASSNPHKVDEIRSVLLKRGIDVIGLDALALPIEEPVEDGETFAANARLKAVYYAQHTGRACLADDSGLEVDALGGEPGVYSARYAQQCGASLPADADRAQRDAANNALLLRKLKDVPHDARAARFVCAMCLVDERGNVLAETRGTFEGTILDQPRGSNGFGYDPLLLVAGDTRSSAELSPEEKNARSHRGEAVRAMAAHLQAGTGSIPGSA